MWVVHGPKHKGSMLKLPKTWSDIYWQNKASSNMESVKLVTMMVTKSQPLKIESMVKQIQIEIYINILIFVKKSHYKWFTHFSHCFLPVFLLLSTSSSPLLRFMLSHGSGHLPSPLWRVVAFLFALPTIQILIEAK